MILLLKMTSFGYPIKVLNLLVRYMQWFILILYFIEILYFNTVLQCNPKISPFLTHCINKISNRKFPFSLNIILKGLIPFKVVHVRIGPHAWTIMMQSYWWLISLTRPNESQLKISAPRQYLTSRERRREVRSLWHRDMLRQAVHNANANRQLLFHPQGQMWARVSARRSTFYVPFPHLSVSHYIIHGGRENQSTEKWLGTSANNFEILFPCIILPGRNF